MREIKFKALIDMYSPTTQDIVPSVCVVEKMLWDTEHKIAVYVRGVWYSPIELMQYIGMKDKNGVEIYEGDTVEVDTTGMNYQPEIIKGIVKYIDGCFTVEFTKPVYDNVLKWMRERLYVKCFTCNKAIKVIGNIYK